jgi:hypothetical protein
MDAYLSYSVHRVIVRVVGTLAIAIAGPVVEAPLLCVLRARDGLLLALLGRREQLRQVPAAHRVGPHVERVLIPQAARVLRTALPKEFYLLLLLALDCRQPCSIAIIGRVMHARTQSDEVKRIV